MTIWSHGCAETGGSGLHALRDLEGEAEAGQVGRPCQGLTGGFLFSTREADPSVVRPPAVGILLLYLPRLQHAVLSCWREVGKANVACGERERKGHSLSIQSMSASVAWMS